MWFWIIPLVASICISCADTANDSADTLQAILSELKQLQASNELRDQKIEYLERQLRDSRHTYEEQLAKQESRITQLEHQLLESETQKANPKLLEVEEKSDSSNQSQRRIRQLGNSPGVAFTAYLSSHASNLGHQGTIPFDTLVLNAGQAFDTITHEFTCPLAGVYTFQSALLSQSSALSITEIVKEGNQLVQVHAEARGASGYDQGFNSVVTLCKKGERVWVRNFQHFGSAAYSERYTTFTGFLLWETEEFNALG